MMMILQAGGSPAASVFLSCREDTELVPVAIRNLISLKLHDIFGFYLLTVTSLSWCLFLLNPIPTTIHFENCSSSN